MALNLGTLFLDIRVAGHSNLDRVQQKMIALERTAHHLGGVLATALVVKGAANAADSYTEASNRIRLASKSLEEYNSVQEEVARISIGTASELESTALLYGRMAKVTDRFGVSSERVAKVTEAVSKSVALGGSNAQEAAGALRQFTQLMGNTSASAQELNSIMEQTPGLSRALADGLGVAESSLKKLFESGAVTSMDVFRAIESQIGRIETQYSAASFTFGKAMTTLKIGAQLAFGELDDLFQISAKLNKRVKEMATWMGEKGAEKMAKFWIRLKLEGEEAVKSLGLDADALGKTWEHTLNFLQDAFGNMWSNIKVMSRVAAVEMAAYLDTAMAQDTLYFGTQLDKFKNFGEKLRRVFTYGFKAWSLGGSLEEVNKKDREAREKKFLETVQATNQTRIESIQAIFDQEEALKKLTKIEYEALVLAQKKREADKNKNVNVERATSLYKELSSVLGNLFLMEEMILAKQKADNDKRLAEIEKLMEGYKKFADSFQSAMGDTLLATFKGTTDGIADMWKNMIQRLIAESMAAKLTKRLFGNAEGIGGLFGRADANADAGGVASFLGGLLSGFRASGGPVGAGKSYLVGENGPEIFTPGSSGGITPNHAMGGKQVVQNFYISTPDANSFRKSRSRVAADMRGAM